MRNAEKGLANLIETLTVRLIESVNSWPGRSGSDKHRNFTFAWRIDDHTIRYKVEAGRIVEAAGDPGISQSWDFTLSAPADVWRTFLESVPPPGHHHLFALWAREPKFLMDGNREIMMQNASFVNRMMRTARKLWNDLGEPGSNVASSAIASEDVIRGSYRTVTIGGEPCRVYVEEAGEGPGLLLLHTAGSDTRQFYRLMNDERLNSAWHLVAFDMPGHGKSFPPTSWWEQEYRLTSQSYIEAVLAIAENMQLAKPVVMGCSMSGALCLELALHHPTRFSGVIACEAAERIPGRLNEWLRQPCVDSAEFGPQWIDGLMSPVINDARRQEILWCYSQAGAGVFFGDVNYYSGTFNISADLGRIDTAICPVYMFTGEYDYSCTPAMSRETANNIAGAQFTELKAFGHFPMAERPEAFVDYLMPVLASLRQRTETSTRVDL